MKTLDVKQGAKQLDAKPSEGLPGVKYLLKNKFVFAWTEEEVSLKKGPQEMSMRSSDGAEESQATKFPFSYVLYTFPRLWLMDGKNEPIEWEEMITVEGVKGMDDIIVSLRSRGYKVEVILKCENLGYKCTIKILPPNCQDVEQQWIIIPALNKDVGETILKCATICQGLAVALAYKEAGNS